MQKWSDVKKVRRSWTQCVHMHVYVCINIYENRTPSTEHQTIRLVFCQEIFTYLCICILLTLFCMIFLLSLCLSLCPTLHSIYLTFALVFIFPLHYTLYIYIGFPCIVSPCLHILPHLAFTTLWCRPLFVRSFVCSLSRAI